MSQKYRALESMICPKCGDDCDRDAVDIGVGTQYGPWRCISCPWQEGVNLPEPVAPPAKEQP